MNLIHLKLNNTRSNTCLENYLEKKKNNNKVDIPTRESIGLHYYGKSIENVPECSREQERAWIEMCLLPSFFTFQSCKLPSKDPFCLSSFNSPEQVIGSFFDNKNNITFGNITISAHTEYYHLSISQNASVLLATYDHKFIGLPEPPVCCMLMRTALDRE